MTPTLSIFFVKSKSKSYVTVTMEGLQLSVPVVSGEGQKFVRSLSPGPIEMDIQLIANGMESMHKGLCAPINTKLAKAATARSEEAASLLLRAVDAFMGHGNSDNVFDDAHSSAFELLDDIVSIRKILRSYVLGPKRAKKSVLIYLPDQVS